LTKHETNLTTTNADVTSWNIAKLANVALKFCHEGLTESHYFTIRLALWVEV
jgi:hypothetical protein